MLYFCCTFVYLHGVVDKETFIAPSTLVKADGFSDDKDDEQKTELRFGV
jgi:hypothetical protein